MVQEYKSILVPLDGSEAAELAFTKAIKIAKSNKDAHIDILNVLDTRQFMGNFQDTVVGGDTIYQMTNDAESYLQGMVTIAKEELHFQNIEYHIRFGSPKRVIAREFLQDHHNDLIILGATGMSAMERILMGSVTEYVNRNALCDVLVVRTDVDNNSVKK